MPSATLPRLRAYRASDGPFVEKLAKTAFGEYSPRAGPPSVRAATAPGTSTAIALIGEKPVGFAMLTLHAARRGSIASLDAIAVEPAHRGRGVGEALLANAERTAKRRGASELRLVTAEANVAALDLFLRSGFVIVERHARYYPRGQNAVAMRKTLAP